MADTPATPAPAVASAPTAPAPQIPTKGRIVLYTLNEDDATAINRRRTNGHKIRELINLKVHVPGHGDASLWPAGAQAHIGNEVKAGNVFPAMIVAAWGDSPTSAVNLQVFLDGNDTFWVTSVSVGTAPHSWAWPTRS